MKKPSKQMIFALPFFLEKNVNTLLILGCSFKNTVFGRETVKLQNNPPDGFTSGGLKSFRIPDKYLSTCRE